MAGDSSTDEALMHEYVAGDAGAFEALYDRYERRVFGFFLRALGDRGRAEDLLQETFLNLHRARRRYRGGGFAAWIHAIAFNLYRQECRRRARKPESPLVDEPSGRAPDPTARLGAAEELERVRRALEQISPAQREAIVLCRFLEMDYEQAAEVVGCSADAMKLRVFRGLRALRDALEASATSDNDSVSSTRGGTA